MFGRIMFGRPARVLFLLGAAMGIPYAWFNQDVAPQMKLKMRQWSTRPSDRSTSREAITQTDRPLLRRDSLPDVSFAPPETSAALTGGISELEQILHFGMTPHGIMQRWSRVSTIHSEAGLEGLRVAVVTGTGVDDLAGSLTYYFDNRGQLQRITFDGLTGDERRIVRLASQQFSFRAEPARGAGLYVASWNREPTGVLQITRAPVVRSRRPHERLEVMFELNQPVSGYALSTRAQQVLNFGQLTNRW